MRLFSLIGFHLKQYSKNSYFLMNVVLSTVSLVLFQFIASKIYNSEISTVALMRAGVFGLWASGVTAAGIIGMQQWQGTLLYLLNNTVSDYISLFSVVVPAATFGLLSFPIAYIAFLILGIPITFDWLHLVYIFLLWIGATVLDLCIATLFVLTKDAIIYEEIVSLPLLLFSGLFSLPSELDGVVNLFEYIIPISLPIQWLLQQKTIYTETVMKYGISLFLVSCMSYVVAKKIIKMSKEKGQFGGLL